MRSATPTPPLSDTDTRKRGQGCPWPLRKTSDQIAGMAIAIPVA
jgi:hypothetical protein